MRISEKSNATVKDRSSTERLILSIVFALFCAASFTTRAAPVYDNGTPDRNNGFEITHWIEADDFYLSVATRLTNVTFWDFEIVGAFQNSVVWEIYSPGSGNNPGTLLYSGTSSVSHTATGFVSLGFAEYVNTFDITPVSLPAGGYWLAIHNGPLTNNIGKDVFWETTQQVGAMPSRCDLAPFVAHWLNNGATAELAFQIFGQSAAQITSFTARSSTAQITFSTVQKQQYRVEYKNTLADSVWTSLPGADSIQGTGENVQVTDSDPLLKTQRHRIYRVVLL